MTDQYHMDLDQFSLEQLKQMCEAGNLLPSERILQEETAERFAVLQSMDITNLAGLIHALSTRTKT